MTEKNSLVPFRGYWEEPSGHKWFMWVELDLSEHLSGKGEDQISTFTVRGTLKEQHIDFLKIYPTHGVRYSGTFTSRVISGTWHIPMDRGGSFRLWREAVHYAEAKEEEKTVSATADKSSESPVDGNGGGLVQARDLWFCGQIRS